MCEPLLRRCLLSFFLYFTVEVGAEPVVVSNLSLVPLFKDTSVAANVAITWRSYLFVSTVSSACAQGASSW